MNFVPNTEADRQEMLAALGVDSVDALFDDIPEEVRFQGKLNLPAAMSEEELMRHLQKLSRLNQSTGDLVCFRGGGVYDHMIPAVVDSILQRNEFYTAYTPYQAEVSQGNLQAIYEFQSLICRLTGMDVANASVYDGASAVAEAANTAVEVSRRQRNQVVVSASVHPDTRAVLDTYGRGLNIEVETVPFDQRTGQTDRALLREAIGEETACVIVQHPNVFGLLEPVEALTAAAHEVGALAVASVDPLSLGILSSPGEYGADIAVGEGQALGNPLSFGGPHFGFFAVAERYQRQIPGRIAGATVDAAGDRGYVLTLQAREQHIRRERATSNICTNQALNALAAAVYLSALGKQGMEEVAYQCLQKAHYTFEQLLAVGAVPLFEGTPFFKEFPVRLPAPVERVNQALAGEGIMGGLPLRRINGMESGPEDYLVAVTERRTRHEIDRFVTRVGELT